jgi:hypothetical protein
MNKCMPFLVLVMVLLATPRARAEPRDELALRVFLESESQETRMSAALCLVRARGRIPVPAHRWSYTTDAFNRCMQNEPDAVMRLLCRGALEKLVKT